jgi:hypothetical protein
MLLPRASEGIAYRHLKVWLFLDAALGTAAQDRVPCGVLGIDDFYLHTRFASELPRSASNVSFSKTSAHLERLPRLILAI